MSGGSSSRLVVLALPEAERVDRAADRFEAVWRAGEWPCIEAYLDALDEPGRTILFRELIELEVELRREVSERPTALEYRVRFPDRAAVIDEVFQELGPPDEARSTSSFQSLATGPKVFPDPHNFSFQCGVSRETVTERLVQEYVGHLKLQKKQTALWMVCGWLCVLTLILLGVVVYLLLR
jgi:hypothetical protein